MSQKNNNRKKVVAVVTIALILIVWLCLISSLIITFTGIIDSTQALDNAGIGLELSSVKKEQLHLIDDPIQRTAIAAFISQLILFSTTIILSIEKFVAAIKALKKSSKDENEL